MLNATDAAKLLAAMPDWSKATAPYRKANTRIAILQIIGTVIPYLLLFGLMVYTVRSGISYWITLGLAVMAALLLARTFILFHDCCHGSFLPSRAANRIVGHFLGILTFTPYEDWRRCHAKHHACVGDLDRRGIGDVWTMTVEEYRAAPWHTRFRYRLFRNPFILFFLGSIGYFLIQNRLATKGARKRDHYSVLFTNLAILAIIVAAYFTVGLKAYLLVQLPIIILAGTLGIWLFYIQHQYKGVYWARHTEWNGERASLEGASHYDLGIPMRWVMANIGIHHLHHIRPGIPNYYLRQCYNSIPALQAIAPVTIRESLGNWRLKLWDEENQRLVGFVDASAKQRSIDPQANRRD